jgi:acyl-CoA dehydrogenase
MPLVLTEDQAMLRDSAAGFLAQRASVAQLRALRDSQDATGFDPAVWREMADMGWAGIAIDEGHGGLGFGYVGLGLVLEQAGRHLSASPLESTVLVAAPVLAALGSSEQAAQWLPAIAAGERIVSLALQERGHHAPLATGLRASRDGERWVLQGSKSMVLDAHVADAFIVVARTEGRPGAEGGLGAFLVPSDAAGLSVERRHLVDSRNVGALTLKDVHVPASDVLGDPAGAWPGLSRALDIAALGLASMLLGLSEAAFERTLGYLRERRQFGKPIGAFQGLQHRAAHLYAELQLARSIVLQGLQAADAGEPDLARAASAAKAKLCEVATLATNESLQMHGGIGMTDEHDIGLFLKRARVLQQLFGDYHYHIDRFARLSGF